MNKKNKGFTLIELLAIIVILAIIAIITVPIILNVIDNAKRGTAKDSAYGYKDAISKYYVSGMLEDESIKLSGDYNVVDGKLGEYDIPFSGTKPTSGYLTFENNALTSGCLTIDEYKVTFDKGEVTDVEVGECGQKVAYKCIRATELHTEECTQTSGYCYDVGYTTTGSKSTATITYGNLGEIGKLVGGDAFDCDVNGDGTYDSQTERFYYVSDLFNTTSKEFDDDYAVLIYYNNTTNGQPDNTDGNLLKYNSVDFSNNKGPVTAKNNLPTINEWSNIRLSNVSRSILDHLSENSIHNGELLPSAFMYEKEVNGNMIALASRLLTYQEVVNACGEDYYYGSGYLSSCEYLLENTKFSNSNLGIRYYWLETPGKPYAYVFAIDSYYSRVDNNTSFANSSDTGSSNGLGVRPVIEVLKTDIEI